MKSISCSKSAMLNSTLACALTAGITLVMPQERDATAYTSDSKWSHFERARLLREAGWGKEK